MFSRYDSGDPGTIVQLNGDLRHAQVELQSAQRAANRLRGRFTVEQIALHAEPAMLHVAHAAASGLQEYFSSIQRHVRQAGERKPEDGPKLNEAQIREAIERVSAYMREQNEHYRPSGAPLDAYHTAIMAPFFSPTLLAQVRTVQLVNQRLGETDVRLKTSRGYENLLEFTHLASVTFEDVLVFNEPMNPRSLFHALVHAVQFQILSLPLYTELFVRAFLATRWRFNVPLEGHAFSLESRFAAHRTQAFSVEDEVRLWVSTGRYRLAAPGPFDSKSRS